MLNALQVREVKKLGSESSVKVDIRLISATNRNLDEMVAQNTFRDDLLYRINTIQINLPTLQDRQDDIPLLADYFLKNVKDVEKFIAKLVIL